MSDLITWVMSPEFKETAFEVLVATSALFVTLRYVVVPALAKLTDLTATKADDSALKAFSDFLDAATKWVDALTRIIPRVAVGPTPAKAPLETKSSRHPPPLRPPLEAVDLDSVPRLADIQAAPPDPLGAIPGALDSSQEDTRRTRLVKPPPQA